MSTIDNKATVQRLVDEGWNGKHLDAFDATLAPNLVNHDPNNPSANDLNGLKQFAQAVWTGFPDFSVKVTDWIAEGDHVAKMWVAQGTQTGAFLGIPATGKKVNFGGISVYKLEASKIVSISWSYDMLGMLQQMGVVPALGPAPA
jgi:steroid delta-isomerase-like uncharacterized protein